MTRRGTRRPTSSRSGRAAEPDVRLRHIESGRVLAFHILQQHDATGRFVRDLFTETESLHALSRQERGLAVDVTAGVLRRRRTIDLLLQSQIARPRADVERDLWRLLQIGTAQLVFGRAPDHAAVDTTVELTRTIGRPHWAGFVNGVLRNVGRLLTNEIGQQPGRNTLPLENGTWRTINRELFSCPVTKPAEFFGEVFSLPRSIARRWQQRMKPADLTTAGFYSLRSPRLTLRVNKLRATPSRVLDDLAAASVDVTPGDVPEAIRLNSAVRIESLPGYVEGHWSVQDESAMTAGRLLAPQPGEQILDLCAAPGGKATHMAELSRDEATIHACDVSEERLRRIIENAARLKLDSIRPVLIERNGDGLPDVAFDAALVDVPCSNSGVLARRPEARWRFRDEDLPDLVQLQTRLLMTAFDRVRPGGRIVYSTCSIEPEETRELIQAIVSRVPGMSLVQEQLHLPGQPSDGAWVALLRRVDGP